MELEESMSDKGWYLRTVSMSEDRWYLRTGSM